MLWATLPNVVVTRDDCIFVASALRDAGPRCARPLRTQPMPSWQWQCTHSVSCSESADVPSSAAMPADIVARERVKWVPYGLTVAPRNHGPKVSPPK